MILGLGILLSLIVIGLGVVGVAGVVYALWLFFDTWQGGSDA